MTKHPSEYLVKATMEDFKERVPNDYRQMDDTRNDYGPAMTKEEEEAHYEKLADIELDSITY